jgi:hypothetical protein
MSITLTSPAIGLTPILTNSPAAAPSPAAASYTSPFVTLSDSYTPIIPSYASTIKPVGATIIIPDPLLPLPLDFDVSRYPKVRKQIISFFRFKTLDRWIYEDMSELLNYLRVDNGRVHFIEDLSDFNRGPAMDDPETIEQKVNYIEQYLLTDDVMYRILDQFVRGTGINWVYLHRNEYFVREHIRNQLKKYFARLVTQNITRKPAL